MVDINTKDRTVRVKIVYYGPALGGKTTNLRVLHQQALQSRRGELISVNSMQDRTILCDLLPLRSGGFRGFDLRLQLLAVPGQAMYAATRRVVLKAADGVVFVANSASDRFRETVQSLEEMSANLLAHQLDPRTIPLVFQYNKRDLPQTVDVSTLQRELNNRHVSSFPAVATQGKGVLETFSAILDATMSELCRRYRTMELPGGQSVQAWTAQTVQGMFGRDRLDAAPSEDGEQVELADGTVVAIERSGHRRIQVTTPEASAVPAAPATQAGPEARPNDSLLASYAEASTELGFVVSALREERDAARARLQEMRQALELASESARNGEIESRITRILQVLLHASGASAAALRLMGGAAKRTLVLPPLSADPLSRTSWGRDHLDALGDLDGPLLEEAVESAELTDALRASQPSFEAAVIVPLRSAERLIALTLLYYDLHAVLPTGEALVHLGFLARELAGSLEASAAREASWAAERLRVLSVTSAAAVASLISRLPPESIRGQRIDLAEVLARLKSPGVIVEPTTAAVTVLGDAPLIRFVLASLVHLCEADALAHGESPRINLGATLEGDTVCVRVASGGRISVLSLSKPDPGVSEAELNIVQALVDVHGGVLETERRPDRKLQFTLRLQPA